MDITCYVKHDNSVICILFVFIVLILGFSTYTKHNLYLHVYNLISVDILLNPMYNNICITNKSIQSLLYKLCIDLLSLYNGAGRIKTSFCK